MGSSDVEKVRQSRNCGLTSRQSLLVKQNVYKHKHTAHPADPESPAGLLDNISDTLLNAFVKMRKPDERFVEMKHRLDQFEEGLASIERLGARSKTRLGDLSGDYEDLATSVQGLGYLESGITDPLSRFERALIEFGHTVRDNSGAATDPFLEHLHSLLAYSTVFRGVLKLRDQKQLDFEELSTYLSNVVSERDRLAGGFGYGMGIGNYFKEKVESFRGGEVDGSREVKIAKLDVKIKEVSLSVLFTLTRSLPWDIYSQNVLLFDSCCSTAPERSNGLTRYISVIQRRSPQRTQCLPTC